MSKGKLFVISGASGVGKSTVLRRVMERRGDLIFSVSATTRKPRAGEIDGVSYDFITKARFERMIAENAFIEYDAHNDNYYGTPRAQLDEKLTRGNVLLDVEPNGAFAIRAERSEAVLIFVMPPSMQELERRLRGRADTSEEQIRSRLTRAAWEITQADKYDYTVVNEQVEPCADQILHIIAGIAGEEA